MADSDNQKTSSQDALDKAVLLAGPLPGLVEDAMASSGFDRTSSNQLHRLNVTPSMLPSPTTTSLLTVLHGHRISVLEKQASQQHEAIRSLEETVDVQKIIMDRLLQFSGHIHEQVSQLRLQNRRVVRLMKSMAFCLRIIRMQRPSEQKFWNQSRMIRLLVIVLAVHLALKQTGIYQINGMAIGVISHWLVPFPNWARRMKSTSSLLMLALASFYVSRKLSQSSCSQSVKWILSVI